jgi:hypothetical protein
MPLSTSQYYEQQNPGWQKGGIRLAFVMLRSSTWYEDLVREHLEMIARVYAQCGVAVKEATLVEVDPPQGRTRFLRYPPSGTRSALNDWVATTPIKDRAVFYLFRGFEDEEDDRAYSEATWEDGKSDPALANSVLLPSGVNLAKYREERAASPYSVAAHELLHILTRQGQHENDAVQNLLNIWRTRTDFIRPTDCSRILRNALVDDTKP